MHANVHTQRISFAHTYLNKVPHIQISVKYAYVYVMRDMHVLI